MGITQWLAAIRALPPERQSEVFDFVQFLAERYGNGQPPAETDWTDAEFSELAIANALRGIEDDDVSYSLDDVKHSWR